jgi:ubiquitin carboxyl-terminal hydrolase 4/11/15
VWQKKFFKKYIDETKVESPEIEIHESATRQEGNNKKSETISLYDCLRLFNEEEQLSEADQWYCSDCKQHVCAFKKFSIWTAPRILVVHLKRFSYRGRMFRERLDHLVQFPLNDFNLTEFVEGPLHGAVPIYELFAVSNHYGSLGGGHYTAYAKSRSDEDTWFLFDDSSVSTVRDPANVVSTAAYVLFYRRKDINWPAFDLALDPGQRQQQQEKEVVTQEEVPVVDEYSEEDDVLQERGLAPPQSAASDQSLGVPNANTSREAGDEA